MKMTAYAKAAIVAAGLIGALMGALSALDGGPGLIAVMATLGAAFGVPIGAGVALVLGMVSRLRGKARSGTAGDQNTLGEWHQEQFDAMRDEKAFRDEFYPGNPDPEARAMTGWGLPRGHRDS